MHACTSVLPRLKINSIGCVFLVLATVGRLTACESLGEEKYRERELVLLFCV